MKVAEKLFPHFSDEKLWEFFLACDVLYLILFVYGNLLYWVNDMLREKGIED